MNPTVFQEKRILQFFKKNESYNFSRQINPTIFQKNESYNFSRKMNLQFFKPQVFIFSSTLISYIWYGF